MSTILITGASGSVGKPLAGRLAEKHQVICLSRKNPGVAGTIWIRGDFASFEDLRQLDSYSIDTVVHLAAVTGGCLERDGLLVNVEGSRCLMRYLIDRGCPKFVMASSIALVGLQSLHFRPQQVPIPDEHPCLDREGYGFSKCMMEEVTRYYQRQNPQIDVINLRLAAITSDEARPGGMSDLGPWSLAGLACMVHSDAVRLFAMAAEAPCKPGLRILNGTCAKAWSTVPTAQLLRHWWGPDVDLRHYEQAGHTDDAAFDARALYRELGFEATATLAILEKKHDSAAGGKE
jgi:UDP-glucose 4-epimerase